MRDPFRVFTRLSECHHIIRDPLTAHTGILLDLFVQKPKRFCPLHGGDRVLPDADLGMVDKSKFLHPADHISPEVPDSDVPIPFLACRKVHAVDAHISSRHHYPEPLPAKEHILLCKFLIGSAVAHVPVAV